MYLHNFGFSLKSVIPKKNYRIILILTLLSLITVMVPAVYLFNEIEIINRTEEMTDWGEVEDTDYISRLKTKYKDKKMLYVISIGTPNKAKLNPKYKTFRLTLKDKDGFEITSLMLDQVSRLVNKNEEKYGISANSYYDLSLKDYLEISNWSLSYYSE